MAYISVDRRDVDGAIQISIGDGSIGYRIAGPKYDGSGRTLLRKELSDDDVVEIRRYLHRRNKKPRDDARG